MGAGMKLVYGAMVAAVMGMSQAEAASLGATDLLKQFNLITTGDVTGASGGHIHGRALVGGNFSGVSEVFSHGDGEASDFAALTVAGNVTSKVRVLKDGDAVVGGGLDKVEVNSGASKSTFGEGSAPAGYAKILSDYTKTLALMDASASGVKREGSAHDKTNTYNISGVENGIGVLTLTEADIRKDRDFVFKLGADVDWVVVNVLATDSDRIFDLGSTFKAQQNASIVNKVLWNFVGFEGVIFDARFSAGAILADGAKVTTTSGDIEGSVFAASFEGKSQLHYIGLNDGPLPGDDIDQPAPVPLPAAMPLMLAGLGAFAALRRRRKG